MQVIRVPTGLIPIRVVPNDSRPKHWMTLVTPNTAPRIAPAVGPRTMAPMTTGIGRRVMLRNPVRKYPSGVKAITAMTAASRATRTRKPVLEWRSWDCGMLFHSLLPLRAGPDAAQILSAAPARGGGKMGKERRNLPPVQRFLR